MRPARLNVATVFTDVKFVELSSPAGHWRKGYKVMVELLMKRDDIDVNAKGSHG